MAGPISTPSSRAQARHSVHPSSKIEGTGSAPDPPRLPSRRGPSGNRIATRAGWMAGGGGAGADSRMLATAAESLTSTAKRWGCCSLQDCRVRHTSARGEPKNSSLCAKADHVASIAPRLSADLAERTKSSPRAAVPPFGVPPGEQGGRSWDSSTTWALTPPNPKELTPARRGPSAGASQGDNPDATTKGV